MTRRNASIVPLPGLGVPPRPAGVARVRRGVDVQLRAVQVSDADAGLIAVARTLADAIDAEASDPDGSRFVIASIAGRLVPVLLELRGGGDDHGADGHDLGALVAAIRDAPRPGTPDAG